MYVSDNIRFMITAAQGVDMMICGYVSKGGVRKAVFCCLVIDRPESFAKN